MSAERQSQGRTEGEAAQWFARMNGTTISTQDLSDFRAWRREPANDAAYLAVERLWRAGAPLAEDPEIAAALKAAKGRNRRRGLRWPRWAWFAPFGALALASLAGVGIYVSVGSREHRYQTAIGEQSSVALEDGTRVKLDTDSLIAVRFTAQDRRIQLLRGQAFFDVVHDPSRPLAVAVGDTMIRDLGTRFDVRRDPGGVRVTVLEGSVHVAAPTAHAPWTLTRGQQLTTGSADAEPAAVDPVKATSWTSGRLVFEDLSLSTAVAEMNRYSPHRLVLDAPEVGDTKVNGAFDSTDTPAFVSAVTKLYDLKAVPEAGGEIHLSRSTLDRGR